GVQTSNAKIHHPRLFGRAEILCIHREGAEYGRPGGLLPSLMTVLRGDGVDAEVKLIPLRQLFRIATAEKKSTDAQYAFTWRIHLHLHCCIARNTLSCFDGRQSRCAD